jgi:hypothetical protein
MLTDASVIKQELSTWTKIGEQKSSGFVPSLRASPWAEVGW